MGPYTLPMDAFVEYTACPCVTPVLTSSEDWLRLLDMDVLGEPLRDEGYS